MVTQTHTLLEDKRVTPYVVRQYHCHDWYVLSALYTYGSKYKVSNDRDRRTRPADSDLVWATTAQAKQYTLEKRAAVLENLHTYNYAEMCDGKWVYAKEYKTYVRIPGRPTLPDLRDPAWEMDLRNKIKDYSVNLGASVAEFRETADMFHQFAKSTRNAWRTFRGKNLKKWRNKLTTCDVAASELVYSFGIAPLMNDLYSSVEALKLADLRPLVKKVVVTSDPVDREDKYKYETYSMKEEWRIKRKRRLRTIAWVEFDREKLSGFTMGNPLEVGWELVPFSFVVDWGYPLGDWLSSLDALKGVKRYVCTQTRKDIYSHEYRFWSRDVFQQFVQCQKIGSEYETSHQRILIPTIPIPRLPEWRPSQSWRAVMHGLSLLRSMRDDCQYPNRTRIKVR